MKRYTGILGVLCSFIRADAGGPKASIIRGDDSVRLASMLNTDDLRFKSHYVKTPATFFMSDENVITLSEEGEIIIIYMCAQMREL